MTHKLYKILDKDGVELPDHWSGRRRTYDEAKKMVDNLNKNGEFSTYTMIEIDRTMAQQKLYTEEQVKFAILSAYLTGVTRPSSYEEAEEVLFNSLTPIELPSDEEMEEQSWGYREVTKDMEIPPNEDWSNGAKWMKEQILNQNK